jgi:hypothetical protein
MPVLFTMAAFLSAALLFWVEPMVARMILPRFGGAAAVWTTCVLFFQVGLLAGYYYAHVLTVRLGIRLQALVHIALLATGLLLLPIEVSTDWVPAADANPVPRLLGMLLMIAGLPYLVISASAPLLQSWYARTRRLGSADPYFLYAASNLGSMLALLAYPALVEPILTLRDQSASWAWAYAGFTALAAVCAAALGRAGMHAPQPPIRAPTDAPAPLLRTKFRWLVLAFVPSSLMLGATTYISIDISPIPLFWVAPLAVYLLTFILAFSRVPAGVHTAARLALPFVLVAQLYCRFFANDFSLATHVLLHLLTLFVAGMVCHGELARARPPADQLTSFYLSIALGGALGGVLNAIIAPLLFTSVAEYPLALVLTGLVMPPLIVLPDRPWSRALDIALPLMLAGLMIWAELSDSGVLWLWGKHYLPGYPVAFLLCLTFCLRPLRFGLGLAAICLVDAWLPVAWMPDAHFQVMHEERDFFGVLRVLAMESGKVHVFAHGTIRHGAQRHCEDLLERREPLLHYLWGGPVNQVFHAASGAGCRQVAVAGLGTGALAAYGEAGDEFRFFEIDPAVERIARTPDYFTYLSDAEARGVRCRVVLGDARLSLKREPDRLYDIIFLDAFSGDSVPVHLLTREAVQLYLDKLADSGLLVFHISNLYLDLAPPLAALAAELRLPGRVCDLPGVATWNSGGYWVVLAKERAALGHLSHRPWRPLYPQPGYRPWTDDYSNLLRALGR